MTFLAEFATLAMTAIFLENVIFSRALGTTRMLRAIRSGKGIVVFGLILTGMTVLASCLLYPVTRMLREWELKSYLRPLVYLVALTLLYVVVYLGSQKFLPKLFVLLRGGLTFATFNCAVLGTLFLTYDQNFNFAKTLGFGFGSGLGFTLAALLVSEGKRRLKISEVPKAFRGFPVQLLYLGFVALALYGLVGHQLPF